MIYKIALTILWGLPVQTWLGVLTLILLISTATAGFLYYKRIIVFPFKVHPMLAAITIVVAIIHAILGFSIRFVF